ncbi:MAG TPA: tetratricopeptide repeat protein [Candidatus Limnocylindrales bacterium]|nr:tetratricopeptide repeat protein [Candidatus Limnocylindrales bacterium]
MAKAARQRRRADTTVGRAAKPTRRSAHALRLLAICGLLLVAYSNSFQSGLVFDNAPIIGQDPRIRHVTAANLAAIATGSYRYSNPSVGLYRPLTTFSYLVNYAVLGNELRPAGYHAVNLALHCANVALVYAIGIAVFAEAAPAFALAALWGVHPVLSESVTNIVGRADLLAALGVLAGLLLYLKAPSVPSRLKPLWFAGLCISQAAGIFSKESAAVLPGLMLLCDLTCRNRPAWRSRAYAWSAVAIPLAAYFYLRAQLHQHMAIPFADNPLVHAGFWTARLTAFKVIGNFLWLFLWPARLSADYSFNAVPLFGQASGWQDAATLIALALCVSAAALIAVLAMRGQARKPAFFFLAFFFVALAPTSNLIILIGSIMAERFLYLPAVGLSGAAVAVILAAVRRGLRTPRSSRAAWAAAAVACCALAARTYARNLDWKDELSLWTSAVAVVPDSAKAHYDLAKALEATPGRAIEAIAEYRESLRIDPGHADVHDNLANALSAIPGHMPEAIAEYQAALRTQPDRAEPHNDLANALAGIPGRLPDAIAEYRAALRIQPSNPEVHYNLANALLRLPGGESEAIAEYRAALSIDPNHADARENLAGALGRTPAGLPAAIAQYREALRIRPESATAHIGLANALAATPGGLRNAIAEYQAALRIRPDSAEAHYDLGTALAGIPGRLPDAIAEFEAALRNQPDLVEAHVNLGNALAQLPGRRADALREYEAALRIRPDPAVRRMLEQLRAEHRP